MKRTKKIRKIKTNRFSTDEFYRSLYRNLKSDFDPYLETTAFVPVDGTTDALRGVEVDPKLFNRSIIHVKRAIQLNSLVKRYRFEDDAMSTADLERVTLEKFFGTQERLAEHWKGVLPLRAKLVIQRARVHVKRILGKYNPEELIPLGKWGARAAVGHPSVRRFLDCKIKGPYTGSTEHIDWFKSHVLPGDTLLGSLMTGKWETCDSLVLTNVPKTYKSLRSIMPNTLIGGFYSYALGLVFQDRLKDEGLDIRYLQAKHRRMVKKLSKTLKKVTADLSSASDSFVSQLVMMLLPREWYHAVNLGRIRKVQTRLTGGVLSPKRYMMSFMTMGIGFTFQLQTLLFYALLRGIQDCAGIEGEVSVYGDDLIYPTGIHPYVRQIFNDIGFILNDDKTFVKENFRESCGADYYCGVDVRPFQPEGQSQSLSRTRYVCLLYKTINGLLRRWNEFEVPKTLIFLKSEILICDPHICQVPLDFPDYSGIRCDQPVLRNARWPEVYAPIMRKDAWNLLNGQLTNRALRFEHYKHFPKDRPVQGMTVFYWNQLRMKYHGTQPWEPYADSESISQLIWKRSKSKPWVSLITGKWLRHKMHAFQVTDEGQYKREYTQLAEWAVGSNLDRIE